MPHLVPASCRVDSWRSRSGFTLRQNVKNVSFHLLQKMGLRIRNEHYCPVCSVVVGRDDRAGGFPHTKDHYVSTTKEELENLEAEAVASIAGYQF